MAFIDVQGLVREYRTARRFAGAFGALRTLVTREHDVRRALDGVSLQLQRGEAVGYLGPNGAGKSTTIKILTGILEPTQGVVRVAGMVPHENRVDVARRMGVVFGQRTQLWWDLPVSQSFDLQRRIYDIDAGRFRQNLEFCSDLLGVGEFMQQPPRQLSLGQRVRADLTLALLHDPEILFLDEPTIGLDVLVKDRVRAFLKRANVERKTTIFLTTHDLRDIEEICPRLLIMDRGRLVWDGGIAELKAQIEFGRRVSVEYADDPGNISLFGTELVKDEGKRKHFRFNHRVLSAPALVAALAARGTILDVALHEIDIEDVIRDRYRTMGEVAPLQSAQLQTAPAPTASLPTGA